MFGGPDGPEMCQKWWKTWCFYHRIDMENMVIYNGDRIFFSNFSGHRSMIATFGGGNGSLTLKKALIFSQFSRPLVLVPVMFGAALSYSMIHGIQSGERWDIAGLWNIKIVFSF